MSLILLGGGSTPSNVFFTLDLYKTILKNMKLCFIYLCQHLRFSTLSKNVLKLYCTTNLNIFKVSFEVLSRLNRHKSTL